MVLTRTQLDSVLKEKLGQQFLTFSNIANKLQSLMNWFYNFIGKYDILYQCQLTHPVSLTPCGLKTSISRIKDNFSHLTNKSG